MRFGESSRWLVRFSKRYINYKSQSLTPGLTSRVPRGRADIIPYFIANSQTNYLIYCLLIDLGVTVKMALILAIIL
jgi:hypothetical protein